MHPCLLCLLQQKQVTDKRVFYTLSEGGPATFAVSLDSGKIKWAFPRRKGFAFFRKWDIDLPQDAQLSDPLPVSPSELVVVHSVAPGSKVSVHTCQVRTYAGAYI